MTSSVNSKTCEISEPGASLLAFLRSELGLTGVKPGGGEGAYGACTVLVDGVPVLASQTRAGDVAGRSVTTIEGQAGSAGQALHPVQRALAAERASQCGYCTPGMALRAAHPDPGDDQIAAALANPAIHIFDEATSNVDSRTEVLVEEAMARLRQGRTSFVIAQRLSTIRKADTIIVMDAGRIVEQGSHADLLRRRSFYYSLYNSQFTEALAEAS